MTDSHPASDSALDSRDPGTARRRSRRRWLALAAAGVGAAALVLLAGAVFVAPEARGAGFLRGHGPGGHHGRWHGAHLRTGLEWLLRGVDATDEQVERIAALADDAVRDLEGLREAHHERREALAAALAGPSVDRAALERLRQAELAAAEQASERIVAALADAAEVLTPEQRAALLDLHQRFHGVHDAHGGQRED